MRTVHRCAVTLLALLTLSCASANQLSKRSERELAAGDLRRAYQHARAALVKEPHNPNARTAYTRASHQLLADLKTRVLNIASVDTISAARQSREVSALRTEIARMGIAVPADPEYGRHETAILIGAAGICYTRGERELAGRQPKAAWTSFSMAREFVPTYRDVTRRIDQAFEMAVATVAILPFEDQTGVPGISQAISDRVYDAVSRRIPSDEYRFTRLVDRDKVYGRITLAELDELSRDRAVTIGRRVGADEVVMGRVYGLRSTTNSNRFTAIVYRKIVEQDTSGARRERWTEHEFTAVAREREVTVNYDVEVVDTHDRVALAKFTQGASAYARVVWTDFSASGDCGDYALATPAMRATQADRVRTIEQNWKQQFGTWTLPALLEHARKNRSHTRYQPSHRQAFFADCRERPVYLGGLPGEQELAGIALDGVWQPVVGVLKELDAKD